LAEVTSPCGQACIDATRCNSSPESKNRVYLQPHHVHLRKKRNKSNKEPVWRSSTGASGLPSWRSAGSRWPLSQICQRRIPPTKPIITIPITIYGYGNGDDAKERGPERWCAGRERGEYKRDKGRCCSRLVRPLGDRKKDMLRLHPAAASRSPRAPDPRPACPALPPCATLAGRERGQGLCYVSTFYTTLVKKS
jgi:hypothetical protein